jgi:hypothetical protein
MAEHEVEVSKGRPITIPTPEEMEARGAADGTADREAGIYGDSWAEVAMADVRVLDLVYEHCHRQAGEMTVAKHNEAVADGVAGVRCRSNELSAAKAKGEEADAEHTDSKAALSAFERRVTELGDPEFASPAPTAGSAAAPAPPDAGERRSISTPEDARESPSGSTPDLPAEGGPSAWRFSLRRDVHPWVVAVLLALIAGAEFALNARAFQSVREQEPLVLLLAALVGTGMVALAHRVGSNARDVLDIPMGAKGRSPAKLVEIAFEVPGLFGGIAGVASIRAAYFSIVGIRIPTFGLVCLQLALAIAAVGTTMAGRNPAADERRDRTRRVEDTAHARRGPQRALTAGQNAVVAAERPLRVALQALVSDYEIQVHEVAVLFMLHYAGAYATAAGVKLIGELPDVEKPVLVRQAEAWIHEHDVGTTAYLELPFTPDREGAQEPSASLPLTLSVTDQGGERAA